eukprot:3800071-Rhodomonas_salina.1
MALTWTDLSSSISGAIPVARSAMGMNSVGEKLYVFGGLGTGQLQLDFVERCCHCHHRAAIRHFLPGCAVGRVGAGSGPRTPTQRVIAVQRALSGGLTNHMRAALLNDLWAFDPESATWTELDSAMTGPRPPPRRSAQLAADGETLYLFSGRGDGGALRAWECVSGCGGRCTRPELCTRWVCRPDFDLGAKSGVFEMPSQRPDVKLVEQT